MWRLEPADDCCWWCGGLDGCTETCPAPPFSPQLTSQVPQGNLSVVRLEPQTLESPKETLEEGYGNRMDVTH